MSTSLLLTLWLTLAPAPPTDLSLRLPSQPGNGALPILLDGDGLAGTASLRFGDGFAEIQRGEAPEIGGAWRREGAQVIWEGGGLRATVSVRDEAEVSLVEVELSAPREPRWVRTELRIPFAFARDWRLYDGRGDRPGRPGAVTSAQVLGTFPATAVWDPTSGLGVGLDPTVWVSDFRLGVLAPDGRHGALSIAVPLALEATRSERLRFAIGRFESGGFGYLPLLEQFHDSFPAAFRQQPDIDPRLRLAAAAGAVDDRPRQPERYDGAEIAAGASVGWEWKYAKFKMGGDLLGRPEEWAVYSPTEKASAIYQGGLDDYRAWRRDNFQYTVDCGVAPMFYLINWIDTQLADRFADSLIRPEDAFDHRGVKIAGWIHMYTTDERAFPWETSFGDRMKDDLRELLDDLPLAGFAHDVAVGGSRFRPRRYLPGRGYDARGVWVDEGLGIANLLRYAHTLHSSLDPRYRCGTTANLFADSHYAIVSEVDHAIYEGSTYDALGRPQATLRDRLLLGAKPRSWYLHRFGDDIGNLIDWRAMSPVEIRDVLRSRWDSAILWSFRFGWLPCPDLAYGYAPVRRALPVLHDCVQAGWKPVSAMTADRPLWLARYGTELETRLVVMNPHDRDPVEATVRVANRWLGGATYLFAGADGQPTLNQLEAEDTLLRVTLPPRSWQVYRAIGQHSADARAVTVRMEPLYDPTAEPAEVGIIATHLPNSQPFAFLPRAQATKELYQQAELEGRALPEEG